MSEGHGRKSARGADDDVEAFACGPQQSADSAGDLNKGIFAGKSHGGPKR